MTIEEAHYIGYVTKTKGLKGEVQVYFEYPDPEALELDVLFLDLNGKLVPFFVSACKLQSNSTGNLYFDDIDHIDKAQALVKKKIYLPEEKMPEQDDEDFTYHDLEGFIAVDETHGELGEITEINEYPQHFVATVAHKGRDILFPLNEDMINGIDEENGVLLVRLPEGLLEIYLNP